MTRDEIIETIKSVLDKWEEKEAAEAKTMAEDIVNAVGRTRRQIELDIVMELLKKEGMA